MTSFIFVQLSSTRKWKQCFFVRNLDSREHSATVKVISYLEMSCESSFSVYLGDRAERPNVTRKTAERRSCTFLSVLNLFQIRRAVSWESIKYGTPLQPAKWWQHCHHWLWVYFGNMQTSDCIITALALAMCYWLTPWQTHRSWADWPGSAPNSLIFQDMQAIWHRNPKGFKTFYKYQVWKEKNVFALSTATAASVNFLLYTQYLSTNTPTTSIFLNRNGTSQSSHIITVYCMVIIKCMTAVYRLDREIFLCG